MDYARPSMINDNPQEVFYYDDLASILQKFCIDAPKSKALLRYLKSQVESVMESKSGYGSSKSYAY